MNKLLIFCFSIIIASYGSCQNRGTEKAAEQTTTATEAPAKKIIDPNRPKPSNKKEPVWVKPKKTQPSSNRNYYVSKSRKSSDIKADYPYDIALKNAKGDSTNTAQAFQTNGKPTVLVFWLTTCVPCAYEMAAIKKKYEGWQEEADFNFYAISTDWEKNHGKFYERVEEKAWPWETYLDMNREFMRVMPGQLNGLPQTFILDKDGKIVHHKRKYRTGDEDKLFEKIKEYARS